MTLNRNFPLVGSYGVAVENISKGKQGMVSFMGLAYRCYATEDILKYQQVILLSKEESYFKIKLGLDESKKLSVDNLSVEFAGLEDKVSTENSLNTLKVKVDDLHDDIIKEESRIKESTLSTLKTDVKDMKAIMGDIKGMTIFGVLEVKGGNIDVNEYSDDVCKSLTTTLTKLAEFEISTPDIPSGLIVFKYALMVSVQVRYSSTVSGYYLKIYVDGEDKFTIPITNVLTWFDRSLEVSSGSHTVAIWCYNLVGACSDYGLKGIKAVCGIGTTSTEDVKIAEIETTGEGKGMLGIVGKSYGENATISGKAKIDDSDLEKVDLSTTVTKGGSSYGVGDQVAGNPLSGLTYYGKTSTGNIPIFSNYTRTSARRMYR